MRRKRRKIEKGSSAPPPGDMKEASSTAEENQAGNLAETMTFPSTKFLCLTVPQQHDSLFFSLAYCILRHDMACLDSSLKGFFPQEFEEAAGHLRNTLRTSMVRAFFVLGGGVLVYSHCRSLPFRNETRTSLYMLSCTKMWRKSRTVRRG